MGKIIIGKVKWKVITFGKGRKRKMCMHFCSDELVAIIAIFPFLGILLNKASAWASAWASAKKP